MSGFGESCELCPGTLIAVAQQLWRPLRWWQRGKFMLQLKRIFCPVDLSPESAQALRYAVALARSYAAELFVCHCLEAQAEPEVAQVAIMQATMRNEVAEHVCLACPDAIAWEPLIVEGDPASEIVRAAAEVRADLIVMRSRRRPHAAALLGSIAEAVCRTAPCPVLVTHPNEREWAGLTSNGISIERILLAHDFSSDAEVASAYAISLAQEYQAELHTLHVLAPPGVDNEVDRAAGLLRRSVPDGVELWSNVKHTIRTGKPYREILLYAEEEEMDLICMGTRGAGFGMRALFGSNVDRVLRQAPCPVLIARPLKPAFVTAHAEEKQVAANLQLQMHPLGV